MTDAESTTTTGQSTTDTATPAGQNGGNSGDSEKKFTQADIDNAAKERAARASESARKKLMDELGITDPAEAKALLDTARAKVEADKTETERAQGETAKEKQAREKAEARVAELETERKRDKVGAAFTSEAAKANARNVERVVSLLFPDKADLSAYMGDDGKVNEAAIKKAVADLQKSDAYMFGTGNPGSPSLSGGRAVQPGKEANDKARSDLVQRVRSGF